MSFTEWVALIRDIFIIVLAIINVVLLGVLTVIALQIWRLFRYLQRELPTVAETARNTLTTVEGTTDFVGTVVARPAIEAISFGVAARRFLRVLALGRGRREVVRQ